MKQPINEIKRMQQLAGLLKENESKELFIYLVTAEDDPEHLVYGLFDKDDKLIQSNFEDTKSAETWAEENGYIATQL